MNQLKSFEIIFQCEQENKQLKEFLETRGHEVPACVNGAIIDRLAKNKREIKHEKELLSKSEQIQK